MNQPVKISVEWSQGPDKGQILKKLKELFICFQEKELTGT